MSEYGPASQYLQERLQERRTRNTRPRRSRHTDLGPLQKGRDDDIFLNDAEETRQLQMFDSSPMAATSVKSSDVGSNTRKRAPGVRDMDQQLDRLSKQNFALKLELDHRREQTQKLQEQIELMTAQVTRAEILEDEHKELLKINTQMVEELERRDKAIEEAMDIICDLEERVADMDERNSNTRPSTANADSGYAGTETQENVPSCSPPQVRPKTPRVSVRPPSEPASAASQRLQGLIEGQTPAKSRREPSILSQKRPSTNALRSVYMENARGLHPVKSFHSLLSRQESRAEDDDSLSSPRLSVLSESSFPSLYSPKKHISPDRFAWEEADGEGADSQLRPQSHLRQDSIKRVSQWISERDLAETTPSKSNVMSTAVAVDADTSQASSSHDGSQQSNYQSLNNALVLAAKGSSGFQRQLDTFDAHSRKARSSQPRPTSFAGPIFGEPLLPPTPDSASTRMLRASRSSIADDRSLLDSTPIVPKGYDTLQLPIEPGLRTAPRQMRSSVELRTALASNMEYRNQVLDGLRSIEAFSYPEDANEHNGPSEIAPAFGFEDDEFPDGKSIMLGTPRRLLKHARPPVSSQASAVNHADAPPHVLPSAARRRRSSDQNMTGPAKPRLSRVETSPISLGSSFGNLGTGDKTSSVESITSPHSVHSGSSGNRTVVQADEQHRRTMSPVGLTAIPQISPGMMSPTRSRASPSPGRTLSQKTATLFRRLSNSHGSDRERDAPSTMASGPTVVGTPNETKRPRTSHGSDRPPTSSGNSTGARPPSARDVNRPPMQLRTRTEPHTARPPSTTDSSLQGLDKDKKGFFKRTSSVKASETTPEANDRGGASRRRGSLREAVATAKRPWR